ncbi:aprataxin and PNK-like factor isoform X2 [Esox lucius]|uniref:aprataxin and PNK-like factor isoform X2 n=1 Tax=Esox lucius TaxID=8010 RepID=UPI0014775668|nr:aprataxin and PNK-like factor isoform X2 [Esox lucius]
MAGFHLVPVGGGSTPINLPEGETLLGRGPFLGTHVNPCFCQTSLDDPPQPLERDQWHRLGQGDIFSLLPGKYMYKVVAVAGEYGTLKNSQALQDEEEAIVKTPSSPEPGDDHAVTTGQGMRGTSHTQELESELQDSLDQKKPDDELPTPATPKQAKGVLAEAEKDQNKLKVEPKKRVLPAWMMVPVASLTSPSTSKGAGNRGVRIATPMTNTNQVTAKRGRATAPSSGEESEHSEAEPVPRKRIRRINSEEDEEGGVVQSKAALKARQQVKPSNFEDSEESDHSVMEVDEDGEKRSGEDVSAANDSSPSTSGVKHSEAKNKGRDPKNAQKVSKAEHQGSGAISGPAQSKPPLRTPCQYGKHCYRKNPFHFQECSHPGDSDYENYSEEVDEDDEADNGDRPECPYGTDCYRKNPLHRKEYRHSKKTRAKKPVSYNNEEEDDDSGDNDSFINDESEDNDEDSDYEPPDSDDSGKEDLERLKKEAKNFMRLK